MIIRLSHQQNSISQDEYKKFSKEEFCSYVQDLAFKMGAQDITHSIELANILDTTGAVGQCEGVFLSNQWILYRIIFDNAILDGETYTIPQIEDTVKHELCHYIANSRTGIECGHNDYWKSVCKEFNYCPNESLPLVKYNLGLNSNIIPNYKSDYDYVLKCNKCGKIYYQSNSFDMTAFQFFLLCTSGLPLTYSGLTIPTECCQRPYDYEADAEGLVKNLKSENCLSDMQESIENDIKLYTAKLCGQSIN